MNFEDIKDTKDVLMSILKIDRYNYKRKLLPLLMLTNSFLMSCSSSFKQKDESLANTENVVLSNTQKSDNEAKTVNYATAQNIQKKVYAPIKLYIFPFGGDENTMSHAALEYHGNIIDYGSKGFSRRLLKDNECYVYEIDPQKAGIDTDKLEQAIIQRQKELRGKDYNYLTENCADQVIAVLEEAGAKDIKKLFGISIPMLNGLPSLDDWAEKYGTLIQTPEEMAGKTNLAHYLKALIERRGNPASVKFIKDRKKVRNCLWAMADPEQYRKDIKKDYKNRYTRGDFFQKAEAEKEYSEYYLLSMLPQEELARQVASVLSQYPDNSYKRQMMLTNRVPLLKAKRCNTLSQESKDILHSAGFSDEVLGRSGKQHHHIPKKMKEDLVPQLNIYENINQRTQA